jgi:hypothetical protein
VTKIHIADEFLTRSAFYLQQCDNPLQPQNHCPKCGHSPIPPDYPK